MKPETSAPATPRSIRTAFRWALAVAGSLSWIAGATAVFKTSNGAGAVALIAAGAVGWVVALIGRWPSRVAVSGNELAWDQVDETIETQIQVASESGEGATVIRELAILRQRLLELQRTGAVSEHPAARYDRQVEDAISRTRPKASIFAEISRTRSRADFTVQEGGQQLLVETKWRADAEGPFRGSTLKQLTGSVGQLGRLLVISNSRDVRLAQEELYRLIGRRGRVVSWRSSDDDAGLAIALRELFDGK